MPIGRRPQRYLVLFTIFLLWACQSAASTLPTAPAATAAPTAELRPAAGATSAPTSSAAATLAPMPTALPAATVAPQPSALLPAPLYFVGENGQIWRLERDGTTKRQLTFEDRRVLDFDVAAGDGALAYLVGEHPRDTLVLLDQAGRAELVSGPVDSPVLAPDGEQVAFQLFEPVDGLQIGRDKGSDTGVWSVGRAGGRPSLIQPSDPISDTNDPPTDARQYFPVAFSPDGSRLLLGGYYPVGEGGFVAVKQLPGGPLVRIEAGCCQSSWSADGSAVLISGGTQVQDAYLGLWRANPATGQATALLDSSKTSGSPLATGARQLPDGSVVAFVSLAAAPEIDRPNRVQLQRVGSDGTLQPLRDETFAVGDVLWAPDGHGAVINAAPAGQDANDGDLSWVPADRGAVAPLGVRGLHLRWGPEQPAARADACGRYQPSVWEPPAGRQARPAVRDIQRRLIALGYTEVGAADGLYGDQTRAAVRAFQQALGLPASGDVDCATWGALLRGTKP